MEGNIKDFDEFEVKQMVLDTIEKTMSGETKFEEERVKRLSESLTQQVLLELAKLKKPFKYLVTSTINQRNGAALCSVSKCFFNTDTDNVKNFRWENDDVVCVVSIFILSIYWKLSCWEF